MKKKEIVLSDQEIEIRLKRHEIEGGYIYIPKRLRAWMKENLNGDVRLVSRNNTFVSKIKMDNNGRIYTILSNKGVNTLSDWFRANEAEEGDILRIRNEMKNGNKTMDRVPS